MLIKLHRFRTDNTADPVWVNPSLITHADPNWTCNGGTALFFHGSDTPAVTVMETPEKINEMTESLAKSW